MFKAVKIAANTIVFVGSTAIKSVPILVQDMSYAICDAIMK